MLTCIAEFLADNMMSLDSTPGKLSLFLFLVLCNTNCKFRGTGRTIPFICNGTGPGTGTNLTSAASLRRREFNTIPQAETWDFVRNETWELAGTLAENCYESRQDT